MAVQGGREGWSRPARLHANVHHDAPGAPVVDCTQTLSVCADCDTLLLLCLCRYYTFQFHMQELSEALYSLQHTVRELLAKLPANAVLLRRQAAEELVAGAESARHAGLERPAAEAAAAASSWEARAGVRSAGSAAGGAAAVDVHLDRC
jgi:hypothetical protein